MAWTKRQRFEAVLAGETADRPPVSAWRHFIDREQNAQDLASVTVEFQEKFDWDFVKINPRASYYAETWGNQYDFGRYEGVVPALNRPLVIQARDLELVTELHPAHSALGEHLTAIRLIREALGPDVPLLQTIFSPLGVLEHLVGGKGPSAFGAEARAENGLLRFIAEDRLGVHRALKNIARTLAGFAQAARSAGADGIFYATLRQARTGYFTSAELDEFLRPYDLIVLEAVSGAPGVLHTCGPHGNPERFADYPVPVLQWADRSAGNPLLTESAPWIGKKAVLGGVDESLFGSGTSEKIAAQAAESVRDLAGRPFLLSPTCAVPITVGDADLVALRQAVEVAAAR